MRLPPRSICLSAVVAAALSLPTFARADIFRYVDKDGTIHFSNHPMSQSPGGGYQLYLKTDDGKKKRGGQSPFLPSDGSPERFTRYDEAIHQAATLYQLPEELVRAVVMVESNYDPRAVSNTGAQGLMQLMPETASRMEVRDAFDPRENIFGGVRYLRILANLFNGDLELTIAGYNAGEGAVMRYGGIPPYAETQNYVVQVLSYYRRYRSTRDATAASVGSLE